MEKSKRKFPSNIRIEKNKDGTAIIHASDIQWKAIFICLGLLALCVYVLYLMFSWPYFSMRLLLLVTIAIIIVIGFLIYFIDDAKLITIRLESDHISKTVRSLRKGQVLRYTSSTIESVRSDGAYQPFGTQLIRVFLQELILHVHTGNESILLGKIADLQMAVELRDFINAYYGLDEKSKNHQEPRTNHQNQQPITNN
jgi:hypothetical protein